MDSVLCMDVKGANSLGIPALPTICSEESLTEPSPSSPSSPLSPTLSARSLDSASCSDDPLIPECCKQNFVTFLRDALNSKNRITVLRLELEIEKFVKNGDQQRLLLNPMPSSYERLAAHRVAQYYHVRSMAVNGSTASQPQILLIKTSDSRVPDLKLVDIPRDTKPACMPFGNFSIKQRTKENSTDDASSDSLRKVSLKSIDQRLEEYKNARARIFSSSGESSNIDKCELNARGTLVQREALCSENGKDQEEELGVKTSNTVAEFRDVEKDLNDPDYDRSSLRYSNLPSITSMSQPMRTGSLSPCMLQSMKIGSLCPSAPLVATPCTINGAALLYQNVNGEPYQVPHATTSIQHCSTANSMAFGMSDFPVIGSSTALPHTSLVRNYSTSMPSTLMVNGFATGVPSAFAPTLYPYPYQMYACNYRDPCTSYNNFADRARL
ncbi:hypothetical protein KP509_11G077300 [Ceratopteris richardii]|uniref:R3H domain-containing protein n=1 Tax=Ceratopteris richardii TaxID=49495 RepID=A0A8T2TW93_CERRI|nr:hypothetical protein KP509_11G077300 [Ceratopteris richardii]